MEMKISSRLQGLVVCVTGCHAADPGSIRTHKILSLDQEYPHPVHPVLKGVSG